MKVIKRVDNVGQKRIPFVPNDHHSVCAVHFTSDDFVTESCDRKGRQAMRDSAALKIIRLKPVVVPSIFPIAFFFMSYLLVNLLAGFHKHDDFCEPVRRLESGRF